MHQDQDMCGRFVSARERRELIEEFGIERDQVTEDVAPDYNVAPTKRVYAVLARQPGDTGDTDGGQGGRPVRTLRLVRWGLVPSWAKDPSAGARLINARAETVAVKPSFRSAFARRRCIIPADGFYEWRATGDHGHGRSRKQPYYMCRADGRLLAFAGIYELWRDGRLPGDDPRAWLWTAAIVTTRAADDLGWIHDRMPVVIAPGHWAEWLDPRAGGADGLREAMLPAASAGLTARPVSTAVNSVGNNGPGLIEPVETRPGKAGEGPRDSGRSAGSGPGRPSGMLF
jgi:putative SOS response-associated peptidase YedK